MGTYTNQYSELRLDGAIHITGIIRLLLLLRLRISDFIVELLYILQHLRSAADDPYRFTPPLNSNLLTWLNLTDIDGYRRTSRLRFGTGIPGCHERDCRTDDADPTYRSRSADKKPASTLAHVAIIHYGSLPSGDVTARQKADSVHRKGLHNPKL